MKLVVLKKIMKLNPIILLIVFLLFLFSCSSHPPFDSITPDTENNKFHYEHLLNLKITPDVRNLYSFGDEIGIDASYYIAFECNLETAKSIINANNLKLDSELGIGIIGGYKSKWWNEAEIEALPRYVYTNEDKTYFKYFWYNEKNNHAYFLDFDL